MSDDFGSVSFRGAFSGPFAGSYGDGGMGGGEPLHNIIIQSGQNTAGSLQGYRDIESIETIGSLISKEPDVPFDGFWWGSGNTTILLSLEGMYFGDEIVVTVAGAGDVTMAWQEANVRYTTTNAEFNLALRALHVAGDPIFIYVPASIALIPNHTMGVGWQIINGNVGFRIDASPFGSLDPQGDVLRADLMDNNGSKNDARVWFTIDTGFDNTHRVEMNFPEFPDDPYRIIELDWEQTTTSIVQYRSLVINSRGEHEDIKEWLWSLAPADAGPVPPENFIDVAIYAYDSDNNQVYPPPLIAPEWHTPLPDHSADDIDYPYEIDLNDYCDNADTYASIGDSEITVVGSIMTLPIGEFPNSYAAQASATNGQGTTNSSEATWTVTGTNPIITTHPQDDTVIEGENTVFTGDASHAATLVVYSWVHDFSDATALENVLTLSTTDPTDDGKTAVLQATAYGTLTSESNPATLTVLLLPVWIDDLPTWTQDDVDAINYSLDLDTICNEATSYSIAGSSPEIELNGSVVTIPGPYSAVGDFILTATATNAQGTTPANNVATWTVSGTPPVIDTQPGDVTVPEGNSAVFSMDASHGAGAPVYYLWQAEQTPGGENFAGADIVWPGRTTGEATDEMTLADTVLEDSRAVRVRVRAYSTGSNSWQQFTEQAALTVEEAVGPPATHNLTLGVSDDDLYIGYASGQHGELDNLTIENWEGGNINWFRKDAATNWIRIFPVGGGIPEGGVLEIDSIGYDGGTVTIPEGGSGSRWQASIGTWADWFVEGGEGAIRRFSRIEYIAPPSPQEGYFHDFTTGNLGDWTHTRDSVATAPDADGIIQTYTGDDPAFYSNQGLQLEAASSNSLNGDLLDPVWLYEGGVTRELSAIPAPDGTLSAVEIVRNAGTHAVAVNVVQQPDDDHLSLYARSFPGDGEVTSVICVNQSHAATLAVTLTEEWQRFDMKTTSESGDNREHFYLVDFRAADTVDRLIVWGPQIDPVSPVVSSYIPSDGTTVTRNDTSCSATIEALGLPALSHNISGQVVFTPQMDINGAPDKWVFNLQSDNGTELLLHITDSGTNLTLEVKQADVRQLIIRASISNIVQGGTIDARYRYEAGNSAIWVNGVKYENVDGGDESELSPPVNIAYINGKDVNDIGYLRAGQIRILPYAASDEEIEDWPSLP